MRGATGSSPVASGRRSSDHSTSASAPSPRRNRACEPSGRSKDAPSTRAARITEPFQGLAATRRAAAVRGKIDGPVAPLSANSGVTPNELFRNRPAAWTRSNSLFTS